MVNGVNFISQHLVYSSITGARKYDHPQSFDYRQPWWKEYTTINDYISRACYLLSQGKMEQRILVLNPATTGFLVEAGKEDANLINNPTLDAVKSPNMKTFLAMVQKLSDEQWDFDYGDEYTLSRHAKVSGKKINVVKQKYDVVIISGDMKNILKPTLELLKNCVKCGIPVIEANKTNPLVEGEKNGEYKLLREKFISVKSTEVNSAL